ncbi:unnamed protein product [Clavelina lepadiformis]|uniref:Uncharacterized protein n=1 Tax=Clavelina lepadiformis TaxID=159417 RepID=A0ABP0GDM3_CLALP
MFILMMQELVGSSVECANLITAAALSRLLGAQVFKKMKGQSDEIIIIDGESCQQSVAKFNTKTIQWSKMPDTNVVRRWPSAVNYNQQILLMGGNKGMTYYNSVEMLELNDENPKWDSNLPSMGEKRCEFASALLNGLVYCAGGYNDTGYLSSCESYNPEERKWSSIRNMNQIRNSHALVSARALLSEFNSFHERTSVQCFHPGFFRTRNPVFSALFYDSKPGVLKCQDRDIWKNPGLLYALGGGVSNCATNTAECYDPRNGKWEYIPPMKTCRYGLTAVVLNNEIYAIGGYDGSKYLSSVEKYNLDTKTWIDVPSMNHLRCGGSACVVDGLIWVFGGYGAKTVEFYDPATNKWQVSTNMDSERNFPCVLSF